MMTATDNKQKDKNEQGQVWNFKGKYADYMRDLYKTDHDDFKVLFDEIYHGYAFCALYGLLKGRKHVYDPKTDNPNNSQNLGFRWSYTNAGLYSFDNLREFILLYSKAGDLDFDKKIDSALRFDYTTNEVSDPDLLEKSQYKENSDLIDEYVLGGLELLHSKVESISSREAMIDFMNEALKEIQDAVKAKRVEQSDNKSE